MKGIYDIIHGQSDNVDVVLDALERVNKDNYNCSCAMCRDPKLAPRRSAIPFLIPPDPPEDAIGILLQPPNVWEFDERDARGILRWVSNRLEKHYLQMNLKPQDDQVNEHVNRPRITLFPDEGHLTEHSPQSVEAKDLLQQQRQRGRIVISKTTFSLIGCDPPSKDAPTELRAKWLPYFYRGVLPSNYLDLFPPIVGDSLAVFTEPDWTDDAFIALFAYFENCEGDFVVTGLEKAVSETLGESSTNDAVVHTHSYRLKNLNGVTVVLLSVMDNSHVFINILGSDLGEQALKDITTHSIRASKLPATEETASELLGWETATAGCIVQLNQWISEDCVCDGLHIPVVQHLMVLMKAWQRFRQAQQPRQEQHNTALSTLRDFCAIFSSGWMCSGWVDSSFPFDSFVGFCPDRHSLGRRLNSSNVEVAMLWCGCAAAAAATLALEGIQNRTSFPSPRSLDRKEAVDTFLGELPRQWTTWYHHNENLHVALHSATPTDLDNLKKLAEYTESYLVVPIRDYINGSDRSRHLEELHDTYLRIPNLHVADFEDADLLVFSAPPSPTGSLIDLSAQDQTPVGRVRTEEPLPSDEHGPASASPQYSDFQLWQCCSDDLELGGTDNGRVSSLKVNYRAAFTELKPVTHYQTLEDSWYSPSVQCWILIRADSDRSLWCLPCTPQQTHPFFFNTGRPMPIRGTARWCITAAIITLLVGVTCTTC